MKVRIYASVEYKGYVDVLFVDVEADTIDEAKDKFDEEFPDLDMCISPEPKIITD